MQSENTVEVRSETPPGRSRSLAAGVMATVILGAAAWWWMGGGEDGAGGVLTGEVARGDIENTVTALGNLQPSNYVDVGAQVSGQLRKLHVAIGDTVAQGDLVAEIDAVVLSAKVESTRAQLAAQRAQLVDREAQVVLAADRFRRQEELRAADATSEEDYQSAKAGLDSARAQFDALKAQIQQTESTLKGDSATLGYSRIDAPIAGTVVSITAREGQTLNANQVAPIILRIADLSTMTVWTQVSEADVPRLVVGMDAYFTTLGSPDRRWGGRLRQILPTPELLNNVVLYTALFDVDNPDGELKTQMSAQVFFVVEAVRDVVTVPVSALHPWIPPEGAVATDVSAPAEPARPRVAGTGDVAGMRALRGGAGRPPGASGARSRPRVQAVTVVDEAGRMSERRVVTGVTNRVLAEVLEGLEVGERVVTGRGDAQAVAQRNGPPGGRPGGGLRFP